MTRRAASILSALVAIAATAACPHNKAQPGAPSALPALPEIVTWSETQPLTSLSVARGSLYAASDSAVVRFDLATGAVERLGGLPGARVFAVAARGSELWVATDAGIARDQGGSWRAAGTVPGIEATTVMLATSSGLWAGGLRGLHLVESGKTKSFLPGARISYLLADLEGDGIWIGTDGEGAFHYRGGALVSHSAAQGQTVRRVRCMAHGASGGVFVVGRGDGGAQLTFFDGAHWSSHTPRPAGELDWVAAVGGETLVSSGGRQLALERLQPGQDEREARAPIRLEAAPSPRAPAGYPLQRWTTRHVAGWIAPPATSVVAHERSVLLATRGAGVAAFDGKAARWYRTRDLTGVRERLGVACAPGPGYCYLAGNGRAWSYDGRDFKPVVVDREAAGNFVHGFVNDAGGGVLALHSPPPAAEEPRPAEPAAGEGEAAAPKPRSVALLLARLDGAQFRRVHEHKITIPSGKLGVRFIKPEPGGKIWVGLEHRDEKEPEPHAWGVAGLALGEAPVVYHRSSMTPSEDRVAGSLALPDDIRDVLFLAEEHWYATANGICRVRGAKVDLFTENEGLESEIVYALARTSWGEVISATNGGLGRFDGKYWRFDQGGPLKSATRALLVRGEEVWAGTSQGLVLWRERKIARVIDAAVGLASNRVLDLYLEADRRLWVLTDAGISILTL
jgi:hypothetical protein